MKLKYNISLISFKFTKHRSVTVQPLKDPTLLTVLDAVFNKLAQCRKGKGWLLKDHVLDRLRMDELGLLKYINMIGFFLNGEMKTNVLTFVLRNE